MLKDVIRAFVTGPGVTKISMQSTGNIISLTSQRTSKKSYKSVKTHRFGVQGANAHLPPSYISNDSSIALQTGTTKGTIPGSHLILQTLQFVQHSAACKDKLPGLRGMAQEEQTQPQSHFNFLNVSLSQWLVKKQ